MVFAMFRLAAAGRPLHHDFADKAAAIDGEMVDVISNMPLVKAFCGIGREHRRFDAIVDREMTARRRSLLYLEKLRILHALVTVCLTIGLAAWAIVLWQRGAATTGDVVLDMHARILRPARHAGSCRRACRRDAAHGPAVRGACDAAGSARAARPSGGDAAGQARRQRRFRECLVPLSGRAPGFRRTST